MGTTVKLADKERLDSEQPGNSEIFPATNMPVYIIQGLLNREISA